MYSDHPSRPRVVSAQQRIHPGSLDADAVRVVERLQAAGFEAYLVGGCVRDLWLGRKPKDFDVATSARPRQIRRLFRNCRIIGRRFKLAHVVFRRPDGTEHIVETATFRRAPDQRDVDAGMLITEDNTFGTAAEDAARRDFTINALFFDPRTWSVIDFVGGLDDLTRERIETIGHPDVRLREDPVRIIRAIKFSARLNFKIASDTFSAMVRNASDLAMSATPRLLEEILRLLRSGHSYTSFQLLAACGALQVLVPEVYYFLENEQRRGPAGRIFIDLFWRDLQALDESVVAGDPLTPAYLHSVLIYRLFERELDPRRRLSRMNVRDAADAADAAFGPFATRMRLPKFDYSRARQICIAQTRLQFGARASGGNQKKWKPALFVYQDYFAEALALYRLHCVALEPLQSQGQQLGAAARGMWDTYDAWYQVFRRKHARSGRTRDDDSLDAGPPAAEATYDELWNLPSRADTRAPEVDRPRPDSREDSTGAPAPEATQKLEAATETPPAPPVDPEPMAASTLEMAAAMAPRFANREPDAPFDATPAGNATMAAPLTHGVVRSDRETIKYKITRPDAKFEFPENPFVVISDVEPFGSW